MNQANGKICVYYDGACPRCVRDRTSYEKLAGIAGGDVCWVDITGQEQKLRQLGIDPDKALQELHVKDKDGRVVSELDAYILLMRKVPLLRPLAWLIALPMIRPLCSKLYRQTVERRLRRSGRLNN
ncbi:thiol-disulfide oxidoreductase DCC family protein [Methylomarinum vadi]|uniref:thiol-disulfide oxidoreductase DCC family protein n=1 Tax=Methylomarinum vadi TaxID=438855 RepID=UPI0004DF33CC|nr:DUF393 domain-containing protein [Methylomarinum vadi]